MLKAGIGLMMFAGIAVATPALAQGVRIDAPGVSVGVGDRDHYRGRDRYHHRDRYHNRGAVVVRERGSYAAANCRTKRIIRSDGSSTTIRKCY